MQILELLQESTPIKALSTTPDPNLDLIASAAHHRSAVNYKKEFERQDVKGLRYGHNLIWKITVLRSRKGWAAIYPLRNLSDTLEVAAATNGRLVKFTVDRADYLNALSNVEKEIGPVSMAWQMPFTKNLDKTRERVEKKYGRLRGFYSITDPYRVDDDLVGRIQPAWPRLAEQARRQFKRQLRREDNYWDYVFDELEDGKIADIATGRNWSCGSALEMAFAEYNKPYNEWTRQDFDKFVSLLVDKIVVSLKYEYNNIIARNGGP